VKKTRRWSKSSQAIPGNALLVASIEMIFDGPAHVSLLR
jgi:hypothetical protein